MINKIEFIVYSYAAGKGWIYCDIKNAATVVDRADFLFILLLENPQGAHRNLQISKNP